MNPLARRRLGRTDIKLPALGFGAAPLGELFERITERQAAETIDAAWDAGLRYFDTSPWYGRGQSEHRVGRGLYRRPREDFVLSTKVGRVLRRPRRTKGFDTGFWAGGLHFDHVFDYTYDGIMRSYEDSMQRLGMNRIDMLVIHDLDWDHLGSDAMVTAHLTQLATSGCRALEELKASGEIGAIGAGVNETGTITRFLDLLDLDFFLVALCYTLGEQPTLETELPLCTERGVGVIIGGAFNSGLYATGPVPGARYNYGAATPEQTEKAGRIEAVCRRHDVPLASAALQFPLHHPLVASVLTGVIDPAQIATNMAHLSREIPDDLWAELKHEGLLRADAPTP